jgi:hypothetical protein
MYEVLDRYHYINRSVGGGLLNENGSLLDKKLMLFIIEIIHLVELKCSTVPAFVVVYYGGLV